MAPKSNVLWQCGGHNNGAVHLAIGKIQKQAFTVLYGCKQWRKKDLSTDTPTVIPVKWQCGNHENPAHIAHNDIEKDNFTKTFHCKKWHVTFVD